ncbi:hypothetical protein [Paucibacter sp. XJ19-41]|uniref:hypothetical protein n=1 Tax=Paucibacter sp. XJ19-41 TaxID=2927824 RepID=UPI00234B772B|nr:hypothetical protein [Paucibacter sp. XJ19-41]MDC6167878.1 hypothetical protein [Paucibacter sp. XJ19-41]
MSRNGTALARYGFAHGQPVALWSAEDGQQLLHADALGLIVAPWAARSMPSSKPVRLLNIT